MRLRRMIAVALGATALVAVCVAVEPVRMVQAMRVASAPLLAAALAAAAVNLLAQFLKWDHVLRISESPAPRPGAVWGSLLAGMAAGFLTPGRVGEFAGRARGLASITHARVVSLTAVDKLYSLASACCMGCAGALLLLAHVGTLPAALATALAVASLTVMIAFPLPAFPRVRMPLRLPALLRRLAAEASEPLHRFTRAHRYGLLARTVLFHAAYIAQLVVLLHAFGSGATQSAIIAGAALLFVKTALASLVPGGLGIREASTVGVCIAMGIPAAAAINAALFMLVVNVLLPAAAGGVLLLLPGNRVSHHPANDPVLPRTVTSHGA